MERHFAALRLPDPGSDPKISRAISFSELPSSRRILIEQCYQADNSGTLIKQYSCEQIFDKRSNSREIKVTEFLRSGSERCLSNAWKTTLPVFGALGKADWRNGHFGQLKTAVQPRNIQKMESMEVEEMDVKPFALMPLKKSSRKLPVVELNGMTLSDTNSRDRTLIKSSTFGALQMGGKSDSSKSMIRSRSASPKKSSDAVLAETKRVEELAERETNGTSAYDYNETKKKLRSLIPEDTTSPQKSRVSRTCYKFVFYLLLSISAALLGIFMCDEDTKLRNGSGNLNIANLSSELRDKIYGQEKAVEELIRELQEMSTGINLVTLIGGTGVGKSYTVETIAKYFTHRNYVSEYFPPLGKTLHEAFTSFSHRHCNLVILENLRTDDLGDVVKFVKFMKEYTRQLCVYTIAILNPREKDNLHGRNDLEKSAHEISLFFRQRDIPDARIIVFEDLNEQSLEACVRRAANEKSIVLSNDELMEIRENLMATESGCKGAYAKVQLHIES